MSGTICIEFELIATVIVVLSSMILGYACRWAVERACKNE